MYTLIRIELYNICRIVSRVGGPTADQKHKKEQQKIVHFAPEFIVHFTPEYSFQLVLAGKSDIKTHGSHNGNKTNGIGVFRFDFYTGKPLPDYFIFGIENRVTGIAEFVVVSYSDLLDRLTKRSLLKENKVEMWLWLMPDNYVYETTNISLQSEWYFLSKRNSGSCMADDTDMDYSGYLNNWNGLIGSLTE